MKIRKSAEDYLETMLILQEKRGYIRSIDIAEELGVKKPSVSYATKRLKENGYITTDEESRIILTKAGMDIAASMYERHKLLTDLLIGLGVGYGVFSMWVIGNFIPIVVTRNNYYDMLVSGYGQEYAQTLMRYIPDWSLAPLLAACFVSGVFGALLGKVLLKKHFVRAGIA